MTKIMEQRVSVKSSSSYSGISVLYCCMSPSKFQGFVASPRSIRSPVVVLLPLLKQKRREKQEEEEGEERGRKGKRARDGSTLVHPLLHPLPLPFLPSYFASHAERGCRLTTVLFLALGSQIHPLPRFQPSSIQEAHKHKAANWYISFAPGESFEHKNAPKQN